MPVLAAGALTGVAAPAGAVLNPNLMAAASRKVSMLKPDVDVAASSNTSSIASPVAVNRLSACCLRSRRGLTAAVAEKANISVPSEAGLSVTARPTQ
ncbi:hypothetical protein D3C86_1767110 [compost metagenome]